MAISLGANISLDRFSNTAVFETGCLFRVEQPSKSTYAWRKAVLKKRNRLQAQQHCQCRMPVQISNGYSSSHMPSFPPTLEEELDTIPEPQHSAEAVETTWPEANEHPSQHFFEKAKPQPSASNFSTLHIQRDSASTTTSESTSSSPTTTVSLAESYNNNTETPITSPDTPASTQSLSSPTFTLAANPQVSEKPEQFRLAPAPRTLSRPSTSHKKPRNLKNLAVDTSSATAFGRAVNTASLPIQHPKDSKMLSPPVSPAFVKPPKPPKRKGSTLGLSIVTPPSNSPPVQQVVEVPQTPSLIRPHALRHFPSSPALPLASPSVPPEGGMRLPPLPTRRSINVGFADAPQEKDEDEPNFDVPQSAEPKPQSYPDGPICIYDPHVYLYYEPNAVQASEFDVVLNVASEVKNPFIVQVVEKQDIDKDDATTDETSSPTTPKAGAGPDMATLKQPDYIHVPWEHNTDIVPDLYDLVKLVDERVQEGKKVLIHCQCGVSRSASLIVAYGLYKNPSMTVQEAYDAVKRRSKWISPNMNLIMQLQEFRSELFKQSAGMPSRGISHRHQTSKSKLASLTAAHPTKSPSRSQDCGQEGDEAGPRSAPLLPEDNKNKNLSITTGRDAVTPGPSSAPSGFAWPTDHASTPLALEAPVLPRKNSLPASSLSLPPMSSPAAHDVSSPSSQASVTSSHPSQSTQASSQASPEQMQLPVQILPKPESLLTRNPPPLKLINLPVNHISRFHAAGNGLDQLTTDSPRSSEFAMNPAKPPTPDNTFGLTSPRVANFQSLHSSLHPSPPQTYPLTDYSGGNKPSHTTEMAHEALPKAMPIMPPSNLASLAGLSQISSDRSNHEHQPSLDTLTSPRSSEFAMTGIGPPRALQNDDSFGLTSPRENLSFAQQLQLPHRNSLLPAAPLNKREAAFTGLHSPTSSISQPQTRLSLTIPQTQSNEGGAKDRRKLRSRLGMSTSSSYDMRSEYVLAAKARELVVQPSPGTTQEHRDSFVRATQDDMADALMSPRATEFTRNPFADALGLGVDEDRQSSVITGERTEATEEKDPRSPVQKAGSSPIVRNIADVFS